MTDRSSLYKGLSCAAWGYLFLNLDFNLGTVSILPRFLGWLLFLYTIDELKEERRDLPLLRPLAILLALWTGADWLASWAGRDVDGLFPPLDLVIAAAQLYFLFQFLTDLAALAETHHPEGRLLSRQILLCRTVQTVLVTLFSLAPYLPAGPSNDVTGVAALILAAGYCILGLWLMISLFSLRRAFQNAAPPPLPPGPDGGAGEI